MSFQRLTIFMLSLQEISGDNKLVSLVEDWNAFEKCCAERTGFYQVIEDCEKIEVRVLSGRLGFKKGFPSQNNKLLNNILQFCKTRGYIQLSQTSPDFAFFK
jgi:hypothetical protein